MKNKGNIILSVIGVVLSIALLVVSTILAEEKIINTATAVVLIAVSVVLVWIAIFCSVIVNFANSLPQLNTTVEVFSDGSSYFTLSHFITSPFLVRYTPATMPSLTLE